MDESRSNLFPSEGEGPKFCYVYWEHGHNSYTYLYYLDTPTPLGVRPYRKYQPTDELNSFVGQLKGIGWQEYMAHANQEAYERWLLRLPDLDSRYEYSVLTCSVAPHGTEKKGLYRLGERNESLLKGESHFWDYIETLTYLKAEGWEFTHHEEYPMFPPPTNVQIQLRFYRRPLA